jgi:hypothetical protein
MADGSQARHLVVSRTSGQTILVASPHILTGPILTVGLAPASASAAVGAVDLDHGHTLIQEHPGEPGAVAAGAFHPTARSWPCRPSQLSSCR